MTRTIATKLTTRTFSLAPFATSPFITTTVDAEKPFTYLRSGRFLADRISHYTVNKGARRLIGKDNYAPFN